MAIIPAAIIGGSAIAGGALSSSSSKKGSDGGQGQEILAQIAAQLFGETEPVRQESLRQAIGALTTGQVNTPLAQQTRSSIQAEGGRRVAQNRRSLARSGLDKSSVGIASEEDINRSIASLLSQSDLGELSNLTNFGRSIGFGTVPQTATSAAGQLAGIQAQQQMFQQQQQLGTGKALGEAVALLLQKSTTSQGGTSFGSNYQPGSVQQFYPLE